MKICGIVAEYNPFHNGHKYQIEKAKEITGCDSILVLISGNFVQRGAPAIYNKWDRANVACENGADIVIELPVIYASSSAEYFASGAISLLNNLGCIDYLCFGCENDDIELLTKLSDILIKEPKSYKSILNSELKKGINYPKARSNSLKQYFQNEIDENVLEETLLNPNNILAIEYLKALSKTNSTIIPIAIKRKDAPYNSNEINGKYASSTAIREFLDKDEISKIHKVCPSSSLKMIANNLSQGLHPMTINNYEKEILYRMRTINENELNEILDVSDNIDNVLRKSIATSSTIDELINSIKSKRYTLARIQRILIHTLLDIKTNYVNKYKETPQYARVLSMNQKGKKIISKINKYSKIPVVTSVANFMKKCTQEQKEMLEKDILATNVYMLGNEIPEHRKHNLDYTMRIK